ncbi:O-Antigen ligase [Stieleria bergensis]|uniref:O-Antigen ligase n=1 Tax=Stieleria bergensis TaxID=2528025 RepID=A0A517SSS0_9BACT|nr:O-Antigen ligase [Planctomycetes bacterium SV_7m_r]
MQNQPHPRTSFKNVIAFAAFLFLQTLSVQVGKMTGSNVYSGVVVTIGIAALFLLVPAGQYFRVCRGSIEITLAFVGLVLVVASAVMSGEPVAVIKAGLLGALFFVVASRASSLTSNELLSAVGTFAALNTVFLVVTRNEWNPNALCGHFVFVAICGMTCSALLPPPKANAVAFCSFSLGSLATLYFHARTAFIGLLLSLLTYQLSKRGLLDRGVFLVLMLVASISIPLFATDVSNGLRDVAENNLNSRNPIAQFLLSDKTRQKVKGDFFDRERLWKYAYEKMLDNPVLGVGYGEPLSERGDLRAHNAYLEIGYQCGLPAMLIWSGLYIGVVIQALGWVQSRPNDPLLFLVLVSFAYLVLAGMMESSGIVSISTPGNWIAVSAVVIFRTRTAEVHVSTVTEPSYRTLAE